MIGLWQTTDNRVRPHSSLGYRPPAPVGYPDLACRLPMAATMQEPLKWLGPKYRSGHRRAGRGTCGMAMASDRRLCDDYLETDG